MGLTLQEALVRALKKLEDSRFRRFIEKLSQWEVRKEYLNIPKDELTGKAPEHVAGLIKRYYRYDYGAEVTLAVLEDIGEKKVREELQQDLREVDIAGHGLGTAMYTDRVNFVDNHRSVLIGRIMDVDPVLRDLWGQDLLSREQYKDVMRKRTSQEKMEDLCDMIGHWEDAGKYTAYTVLSMHEAELINSLEDENSMLINPSSNYLYRVNFIDCHRSDLIRRIRAVDPVLRDLRAQDLLTQEQYNDVMKERRSRKKIRDLCDIIKNWDDDGKCMAYRVLKKHEKELIKELEAEEVKSWRHFGSDFWRKHHFVDRHIYDLINNIKEVNPVIDDLRSNNLLTEEQYEDLQAMTTSEEKMAYLCEIFCHQCDAVKDQLYISLWRYNYTAIYKLHISDRRPKYAAPSFSRVLNFSKASAEDSAELLDVLNSERSEKSEILGMRNIEMKEEDVSCELCEMSQDSVEVITPTMIGSTYHLCMNSPGLFRCSESGIQFRVTHPVTIEYEVDSWSNYTEILQNLRDGYGIIGPLFNIKSNVEPNRVSAVYLPHCLCLGGFTGDKSLIRCFHYKDDNLALETPRMEAMYAVLENPSFSCIGVILYPLRLLKEEIIKLIPYHGMALLFGNTITREDLTHRYRLHLYLLPRVQTLEKEVVLYEASYSFQKIHKPPQTKSVYSKKEYRINGPLTAHVIPKTLLFESHCPSEIYPFTEISIQGEKNTEVNVSILPEDEDVTVWETLVTTEEMLGLPSAMSQLTIQPGDPRPLPKQSDHFMDRHRAHLIRMISVVDLVLDDLLDLNLLTYEQYKTVLSQNTNAEQMRKLYDYIRAWGKDDKDQVYQSLRQHNCPIIRQLENEDPKDDSKAHTPAGAFTCNLY